MDALMGSLGGEKVGCTVCGPRPEKTVEAAYAWCPRSDLAVVEMAMASGITLLPEKEWNPLVTTTRGTGELLLLAAAQRKPTSILMTVGGSATVDGGTGAARALGWRFLDQQGRPVPEGGGALCRISDIVPPAPQLPLPPVTVLCDVTNPLIGPDGAARVFAPQKGAGPEDVKILEEGLEHLASVVETRLGLDIRHAPGSGAAGGLAGGALAWMNATLVPGIHHVLDVVGFDGACRDADWVITGEGKLDRPSLHGKVVSGVIARAQRVSPRTRVAVLAGRLELTKEEIRQAGIDYADEITPAGMPLYEARRRAPELLVAAVQRFLTHKED